MKLKIISTCATVDRSFEAGAEVVVDDALGADLVNANYAEVLDLEAQPIVTEADAAAQAEADAAAQAEADAAAQAKADNKKK